MNNAALSKYYYGSAYQDAELSTPIHSWEHDTPNMGGSYVNSNSVGGSFVEDEQTFFHNFVQVQPSQHELLGQDQVLAPEIYKESTTCGETSIPSSNNLADIPFVQIHTTNLEPPDKSYHNIFRRKTEPIKAEPIKSETTESGKERINSTPTPPARNSSYASIEGKANIEVDNSSHVATPQSMQPIVHKCSACPFISISQDCLATHVATVHTRGAVENFRPRILCPGCENIFYSSNSFDLHLREDHLMVPDEASSILYNLQNEQNLVETNDQPGADAEPKIESIIYIKNVNCPEGGVVGGSGDGNVGITEQQTPINLEEFVEESNNNIIAYNLNDPVELCDSQSLPLKQKISIKSVDVLREPTYANYAQTDSGNINGNNNNNNNICNEQININKNYNDKPPNETLDLENIERPSRPKIYIKNVDILKEPMLFPRNLNVTNIQNMNFNFGTQNIVTGSFQNNNSCVEALNPTTNNGFEDNLPTLGTMRSEPYLFDNTMATNRSESNTNIIGGDFIDTYVNESQNTIIANHNFTLDNTRFVDDLDIDFNYTHTATAVTESTPAPLSMSLPTVTGTVSLTSTTNAEQIRMQPEQLLPSELTIPKQKIFIKNVDILKAPQVHLGQQHQKGTLHLRTVDELNLMNRNEVENLMAPNHQFNQEQINGNAAIDLQTASDDLSVQQISDFVPDFPNSWSNEDYDLGDDLDCIITDTIEPLMNISKSFVTTPDKVDTNPNCPQPECNTSLTSFSEMDSITRIAEDLLNEDFVTLYNLPTKKMTQDSTKQEIGFSNTTQTTILTTSLSVTTNVLSIPEISPLEPATATICSFRTDMTNSDKTQSLGNIVVPPSVPINNLKDEKANVNNESSSIIEESSVVEDKNKTEQQSDSSDKPARIYVANNLQQDSGESSSSQSLGGGTSVRGRPYGSKRTGITKLRKQNGAAAAESLVGVKCSINGCAYRFKEAETLEYHKRCHNNESNPTHSMICPECKSTNFNYWNSLHTHLWRSHQIDMELYRCPQCAFRTPIYSRLLNTHSKIHSEERNYKCDQCGKGFKNTKQLKNHRRWHRNPRTNNKDGESGVPTLYPCEDCGAAFSYVQSLREHLCKNRDEQIECDVCQKPLSSKSSLKLHMLTHRSDKRFKCGECDYEASDHNAFRRHRMVHLDQSKYSCPHCDSKFIQSCSFQRHIRQKHPDVASDTVLKCTLCSYTTINRTLLIVHQAKHECTSVASNMQQEEKQKKPVKKKSVKSVKNKKQPVIPPTSESSAPASNNINRRQRTTRASREAVAALPLQQEQQQQEEQQQQKQQQQQVLVPESAQIPYNQNECSGYIKTKNQSNNQFNADAFQSSESIEQHHGQSVEQFSQILG